MQIKTNSKMSAKPQALLTDDALTIPPRKTKTVVASVDCPSERNTTGTVTTLKMFTEKVCLLISHSMSRIIDKNVPVRVANTTETPYLIE